MSADRLLLVLSIIEGRRFPKRLNYKLLVEAKFDGETLSTDPVDHNENPDFTTELAWESDKKSLHQHRLQRTPIKLQCYAVDANEKRKEPVGYCILDLRTAQLNSNAQKPAWFALLNSKYHGMKPELKLLLSLEDESMKTASPEVSKDKISEEAEEDLTPILDENEGHYLIGDKNKATDIFCLSVTIAAAKNLTRVIPSDRQLSPQDGFYFFYKLLGNDVTSEPFHDVMNPNFAAERASVRMFSSLSSLKKFVSKMSYIQFHFCSGESSLASTTVSLMPVITDEISRNVPIKIEGFFPLSSLEASPPSQPVAHLMPLLGVSIVLRKEEKHDVRIVSPGSAKSSKLDVPEHPFSPPKKDDLKARSTPGYTEDARQSKKHGDSSEKYTKKSNRSLKFEDDTSNENGRKETRADETGRQKFTSKSKEEKMKAAASEANHYCYSIDLRSVKYLDVERPINCFCRYTYPFFGSSSPVLTSPAVEVRKNTEVLLPRSFCAFDFATNSQVMEQTLSRVPLLVEVWHRDPNRKDALLGVCQIDLSSVFSAEKINIQGTSYRQIDSQLANILTPDSFRKKVGSLHVVLGMENLGPIKNQPAPEAGNTQSLISASPTDNTMSEASENREPPSNFDSKSSNQRQRQQQHQQPRRQEDELRDLPEYKAGIELELWKEQQEELFKTMLQEKEAKVMQTLAEEWRKRDREREIIFQRKVDEYSKLEEKMRTTISDLERREKQVSANEAEVQRLKSDLVHEHEQKLSILREASVRMKVDCDHRIEIERLKLQEVKDQCQRYKEQLQVAEKRQKDKENEILSFREQLVNRPETKMQAELSLALLEKAELERKLDQVTKSKIHYKQQWGKALRELAKMKQNEQMAAKMRLKQQERELEHMRLRYLAAEEKEIIKSERKDLDSVKEELQRLRELQLASQSEGSQLQTVNQNATTTTSNIEPNTAADASKDPFVENRIAKLIEERDTLLRTGVYSTNDKIISELDRQIREAIAEQDR